MSSQPSPPGNTSTCLICGRTFQTDYRGRAACKQCNNRERKAFRTVRRLERHATTTRAERQASRLVRRARQPHRQAARISRVIAFAERNAA